jgi:hypothetical protein
MLRRLQEPPMRIVLFLVLFTAALGAAFKSVPSDGYEPWRPGNEGWVSDPAWNDGLAEKCVYEATRTIYDVERKYRATAYTNKERMDGATTTKTTSAEGMETFKHHWSEIVPTEKYDYRFSTCVHVECFSMYAYKLTVSTQEDCGASFKIATKKARNFEYYDSVYFPETGQRQGVIGPSWQTHFVDELPLLLRDFTFKAPKTQYINLVASQKDTRRVDWTAFRARVDYVEKETLELPIGKLDAHHLRVRAVDDSWHADYWMADDATAPRLHVLVKYLGPKGESYALVSQERTAYWKH